MSSLPEPGNFILAFLSVLTLFFSSACSDATLPPGVVATVNGEPITLHAVQTILDSRASGLGLHSDASFEQMRGNYGRALSMLIANALVRQELEKRGLAPLEKDLDQAIERISSDYGDENLNAFLEEVSLRPADWRMLMRDHLALEVFRNQILLPAIKIDFQEVKNYYQEHKKDFLLPETARTCFLSSSSKEELQNWCKDVASHNFMEDAVAQCVEVALSEVPQPWNKELKNLHPMTCGKIHEKDGEWQSLALLERLPERISELSEVYPLVEKILLESKQSAAFDQWLEQKTASARVMMIPAMKDAFLSKTATHQDGELKNLEKLSNGGQ